MARETNSIPYSCGIILKLRIRKNHIPLQIRLASERSVTLCDGKAQHIELTNNRTNPCIDARG